MRIHLHIVAKPSRNGRTSDVSWIDEILERIDGYAIDRLSTGDVLGNHLECFSALGYMAARTSRVAVGPFITTAAVRDVALLAAAGASLDALSGGRAFMVLGRGDGIVRNLGVRPQTVDETQAAVGALRSLLHDGEYRRDGLTVRLAWPDHPGPRVPIYTAPGGPRMLRMSAAVCDGVYLATGCTAANVQRALATIAGTTRESPLDVWWVTRFGIGETAEDALSVASEGLSTVGNHALRAGDYASRDVPEELWEPLREYHRRYRYDHKNPGAATTGGRGATRGPTNVDLMNELGLRDYFLDRFGIVGTPDEVVERLLELEGRGVDSVTLLADSATELDLIGTQVLPRLADRRAAFSPPV